MKFITPHQRRVMERKKQWLCESGIVVGLEIDALRELEQFYIVDALTFAGKRYSKAFRRYPLRLEVAAQSVDVTAHFRVDKGVGVISFEPSLRRDARRRWFTTMHELLHYFKAQLRPNARRWWWDATAAGELGSSSDVTMPYHPGDTKAARKVASEYGASDPDEFLSELIKRTWVYWGRLRVSQLSDIRLRQDKALRVLFGNDVRSKLQRRRLERRLGGLFAPALSDDGETAQTMLRPNEATTHKDAEQAADVTWLQTLDGHRYRIDATSVVDVDESLQSRRIVRYDLPTLPEQLGVVIGRRFYMPSNMQLAQTDGSIVTAFVQRFQKANGDASWYFEGVAGEGAQVLEDSIEGDLLAVRSLSDDHLLATLSEPVEGSIRRTVGVEALDASAFTEIASSATADRMKVRVMTQGGEFINSERLTRFGESLNTGSPIAGRISPLGMQQLLHAHSTAANGRGRHAASLRVELLAVEEVVHAAVAVRAQRTSVQMSSSEAAVEPGPYGGTLSL